jgi:hypothetical protein
MPLLAPLFRELNFQRIRQLDAGGYQPATIARIVNDETGPKDRITAPDVRSYLKIQKLGSEKMLISKKGINSIANFPDEPEAA